MAARRCSNCSLDWPNTSEYKFCPGCEEETSPASNIKPMRTRTAKDLAKNLKFERFYLDWDEDQPAERLDPSNSEFLKTHPIESMTRIQPKLRTGTRSATISRTEKP